MLQQMAWDWPGTCAPVMFPALHPEYCSQLANLAYIRRSSRFYLHLCFKAPRVCYMICMHAYYVSVGEAQHSSRQTCAAFLQIYLKPCAWPKPCGDHMGHHTHRPLPAGEHKAQKDVAKTVR